MDDTVVRCRNPVSPMTELADRWFDLCNRLRMEKTTSSKWWEMIQSRYNETQRRYHTLDHLLEMFQHFDQHTNRLQEPDLVSLAIFFHE